MTAPARLISLGAATDAELARWCLEHWGIPYLEERHAPVLHLLALRRAGGGRRSMPILVQGDEKVELVEGIVARLDPRAPEPRRLLPPGKLGREAEALAKSLRWEMGAEVARWAYAQLLPHRALVWPAFTAGAPGWEPALLRLFWGPIRKRMEGALKLGPDTVAEALPRIAAAWDGIDARLADGRTFLCGDRLTLADLAFATSGAPMVLASGYAGGLPALEDCPEAMAETVRTYRARPAGQFIARIYAEHRGG